MIVRRPFVRAGRPGLLGTVARTAVVAGTATAVAGGVSRRQQARATQAAEAHAYEQQQAAQAAAAQSGGAQEQPAVNPASDGLAELQRLVEMHSQGVLTDEEFASAKSRLLGL